MLDSAVCPEVQGVGLGGVACEGVTLDFDLRQLFEDPDEVTPGVELAATAALNEGIPDGVGLPGLFASHEEPVLGSEFGGTDSVFYQVVVNL